MIRGKLLKKDKQSFNLNSLGIMYELNEDYFLTSAELGNKYVDIVVSKCGSASSQGIIEFIEFKK